MLSPQLCVLALVLVQEPTVPPEPLVGAHAFSQEESDPIEDCLSGMPIGPEIAQFHIRRQR